MEICTPDIVTAFEKQLIFPLLVATSALTATVVVIITAAVATGIGLRSTTEQHPIQQTPVAECSNEKESLMTHNNFSMTVTPVQQTSTDKGELVISNMNI